MAMTFLYITASFPIGVVLLSTSSWGPTAGVALITWPWWDTWWRAIRRALGWVRDPTV